MDSKNSGVRERTIHWLASSAVACALALLCMPATHAADTLKLEVARPLQAAQDLMKKARFKEALASANEAEAVPGKTPYEVLTTERMRGAAAQQAGDTAAAISAYKAVIATGRLAGVEQLQTVAAIADLEYQSAHYAEAIQWATRYGKTGGSASEMNMLLLQSRYQMQDCKGMSEQLAGKPVSPEPQLQLLVACYQQRRDDAGSVSALELLVSSYPTQASWGMLLPRLGAKPGFSERLELDVRRLQKVTGTLTDRADYLAYAQLSLADGLPAEAEGVLGQGFATGALGRGDGAQRDARLREFARKASTEASATLAQTTAQAVADKQGDTLLTLGLNEVMAGRSAKGLSMMEQAMEKGGLRNPDEATLHMGIAYAVAGQKVRSMQTLESVRGTRGESDLARLWIAKLRSGGSTS
jgi:hypothetical protein